MNQPIKFNLKKEWWPLAIIALTIIISYLSYSHLPTQVASHWNFQGAVDGYASRDFHCWFFPALIAGLYALFFFLPMLDPKKERYAEFIGVYNIFKNLIISIMFIIFLSTTIFNLGYPINIAITTSSTIGLLFIIMGNYFGKLKQNWFIGIRTPWTLSSENVWNKTHRLGGKLFVLWGLGLIFVPWLPPVIGIAIFIIGALLATIGTFLYSYLAYKDEQKRK